MKSQSLVAKTRPVTHLHAQHEHGENCWVPTSSAPWKSSVTPRHQKPPETTRCFVVALGLRFSFAIPFRWILWYYRSSGCLANGDFFRFSSSRLIHIPNPRGRYHLLGGKSTASPNREFVDPFLSGEPHVRCGSSSVQIGQIIGSKTGLRSLENIMDSVNHGGDLQVDANQLAVSPCFTSHIFVHPIISTDTVSGWWYIYQPLWKMMEWVSESQLGWLFHSQLIWKIIIKPCSSPHQTDISLSIINHY